MPNEPRCGTCAFFRPALSEKGRPCRTRAAKCIYEIAWPKLPKCLERDFGPPRAVRLPRRNSVWADDAEPCACYMPRPGRKRPAPTTSLLQEQADAD